MKAIKTGVEVGGAGGNVGSVPTRGVSVEGGAVAVGEGRTAAVRVGMAVSMAILGWDVCVEGTGEVPVHAASRIIVIGKTHTVVLTFLAVINFAPN